MTASIWKNRRLAEEAVAEAIKKRPKPPPKGQSEGAIQNQIRLAVGSLPDVRLWRNNTGRLRDSRGVPVSFGLAVGSADLIGILAPSGRLLSLEVKTKRGRTTQAQEDWAAIIRSMGGFACTVRSAEDALQAVERARDGDDQ